MVDIIKSLANDYFSMTGRPIATMTVEEYKAFFEMAKNEKTYILQKEKEIWQNKNVEKTDLSNESAIIENSISKNVSIVENKEKKQPSQIKQTQVKQTHTESNKSNMLKMLQSVSG